MFGRSGRGRSVATCFKPTISVQNLCDSSMSRTFSTRWLMPLGATASAGAAGVSEIGLAIAVLQFGSGLLVTPVTGAAQAGQLTRRRLEIGFRQRSDRGADHQRRRPLVVDRRP